MYSRKKFSPTALFTLIALLILGTTFIFLSRSHSNEAQPAGIQTNSPETNQLETTEHQNPEPDNQPQPEDQEEPAVQPDQATETTSQDESTQGDSQSPAAGQDAGNALPADWDELTPEQKTARNPFGCDLQTHYVRNDNGQCIAICSTHTNRTYDLRPDGLCYPTPPCTPYENLAPDGFCDAIRPDETTKPTTDPSPDSEVVRQLKSDIIALRVRIEGERDCSAATQDEIIAGLKELLARQKNMGGAPAELESHNRRLHAASEKYIAYCIQRIL